MARPSNDGVHLETPQAQTSGRRPRRRLADTARPPPDVDLLAAEQLSIVVRESFRAMLRMPSQLQKQLTSADGWRSGSFQRPSSFWKFPFS